MRPQSNCLLLYFYRSDEQVPSIRLPIPISRFLSNEFLASLSRPFPPLPINSRAIVPTGTLSGSPVEHRIFISVINRTRYCDPSDRSTGR